MTLRSFVSTYRELMANRFIDRDRLVAKQHAKFRRLVAFAYRNSPYYARLIRKRHIDPATCLPQDFPILTKNELLEHFDDIVTDRAVTAQRIGAFLDASADPGDLFDDKYLVVHTSGTSGQVAYYIFTPPEWERGHLHYFRIHRWGLRRRVAHIAAMNGHFHGAVMSRRCQHGFNRLAFNIRRFDINEPIDRIIDGLNSFQPRVVSGYGGALKILAHFRKSGDLKISPQGLFYGGEPLTPQQREEIAGLFGVPVISVYASSEHLIMGATLPGTNLMRMFEDYLIFEFASDHLCVTNLFNYSMPLIRYRMDDVLTPIGVQRRPHPFTLVKDLVGRSEQTLRFVNKHGREDFIHPSIIGEFFVPHVQAFQVELIDQHRFNFRVQLDRSLDRFGHEETLRRIRERLRQLLAQKDMDNVRFAIVEVDGFGIDPRTGKFRLIVDRSSDSPTRRDESPQPRQAPELLDPVGV